MKQKRIRYGVYGMMEYQAVIQIGRSKMKVQFTDGTVTAVGVNPATFTTDNLMVQMAIEDSDQYRRGKIVKVAEVELDKEVNILRNPPKPAPATKEDIPEEKEVPEAEETIEESEEIIPDTAPEAEETPAPEADETPAEAETATPAETTDMEFACNDDAKDYLEKEFGAVRSKLRNRADIVTFGAEHGINITFEA